MSFYFNSLWTILAYVYFMSTKEDFAYRNWNKRMTRRLQASLFPSLSTVVMRRQWFGSGVLVFIIGFVQNQPMYSGTYMYSSTDFAMSSSVPDALSNLLGLSQGLSLYLSELVEIGSPLAANASFDARLVIQSRGGL